MMIDGEGYGALSRGAVAYAPGGTAQPSSHELTPAERAAMMVLGSEFAQQAGGIWILVNGRFTSGNHQRSTESQVREILRSAFGYPRQEGRDRTLNVLLNSPGGSLDSAYTTALYLAQYASELNVHVPDRAKSASTLLAVAADQVYLSAFGELGPLDTQIPDPRNPANTVSALDCYQSVDYVRDFGFKTITAVLPELIECTERRIPVNELLGAASTFALGAITPMLRGVTALDFGGWGRSLRIGEHYARKLLAAKSKDGDTARIDRIAYQLVYGYTHHLFPINQDEADRIGLDVARMDGETYDAAIKVVTACHKKNFVGFISKEHADLTAPGEARETMEGGDAPPPGEGSGDEHALAEADIPKGWGGRHYESTPGG